MFQKMILILLMGLTGCATATDVVRVRATDGVRTVECAYDPQPKTAQMRELLQTQALIESVNGLITEENRYRLSTDMRAGLRRQRDKFLHEMLDQCAKIPLRL